MTTIKSSLTSMNTGDWMQRCLIVLMELSKCPFVHANTADMRALTIAVGRLDVVKLQGVIGSSTGTGRTRLGGRRRSFLVESEVIKLCCFELFLLCVGRPTYIHSKSRTERIGCYAVPAQVDGFSKLAQFKQRFSIHCEFAKRV